MRTTRLLPLYAFVFIDLLGYSLFLPLLPFYAKEYNASTFLVGLMLAANALAQLLATPTIGRLSDRFGRRPLLIFSITGTVIGFLVLGLAEPIGRGLVGILPAGTLGETATQANNTAILAVLFFSRILDGLAGGNIALARAYITDVTDEENRARALGLIGATFGIGFIIGPFMGGTLTNWQWAASLLSRWELSSFAIPALVAVIMSMLNLAGVIAWLPESLTAEVRERVRLHSRSTIHPRDLWEALRRPRFGPLVIIRFAYNLAFTLFTVNFAQYAQDYLLLTKETTSYILSYVGLLVVLVQGVAIGRLTKRFGEKPLVLWGNILLAFTLLVWVFVSNVPLLLVVLAPLALSGGILNTVTNSLISKSVYEEEAGGALGLTAGIESLNRVISPALGGFLLGQIGAWSLGALGSIITALLIPFTLLRLGLQPDKPLPPRGEQQRPAETPLGG
jgi:DHA1 family tetracycline resistance protein-like MFS transporter